jgi:hypothetical protein
MSILLGDQARDEGATELSGGIRLGGVVIIGSS